MPKITISYRRSDSIAIAGRIFDRLANRYGPDSVFIDIDRIPLGVDFRSFIDSALRETDVLIALIGPTWTGSDGSGHVRIKDDDDPVRVEIETALRVGLAIVPLLVGGAAMLLPDELPASLSPFASLTTARVDPGRDFHADIDRLIESMDAQLATLPEKTRPVAQAASVARTATRGKPAPPSGTVTFLFAEVEDAGQRWERSPEAMSRAVRRLQEMLGAAFEARGGYVLGAAGETSCAAFANAVVAIAAALDAQRALEAEDFSAAGGIRVRIALHSGTTFEHDGVFSGPTVHRGARLLALARGGQTIVSGATHDLALRELPPDAMFVDLGSHRLGDLAEPERVYQVSVTDLPSSFSPLAVEASPNNLPLETTPLVGRDAEVVEIVASLERSRVVTLVGSGGIGKTRVALQVAARLLSEYADGVWFVELAPLGDGSVVAGAVAATMGLRLPGDGDAVAALAAATATLRVLLVLDNCEHLIDDVAKLATALLRASPGVRILATSRQALGLTGEVEYRLPALAVPAALETATISAESARRYAAIELFAARAAAAEPRFSLDDDNAPEVADICRQLDGIALAIELAAARVKSLSPAQLRSRLGERFRVLTGGRRDALPRQQTMRALIDWSHDLLGESERAVFRRSAIFAGGWNLEAAEGVVAGPEALDVLDGLASLVEKSLVSTELKDDETRYRLLESTRAYALEKLAASGERDVVARRHAEWVADFVDRAERAYAETPLAQWLPRVEAEIDNARAALGWALEPQGDVLIAARIAGGLRGYWNDAGIFGEAHRWIGAVLERFDDEADLAVAVRLWSARATLSVGKRGAQAAERAVSLAEKLGDQTRLAGCYSALAGSYRQMGRIAEAEATIDRALAIFEATGSTRSKMYAVALDLRAIILTALERHDEARALYEKAIAIYEALGDEGRAAAPRLFLADLEFLSGDARRALALAERSAAFFAASRNSMREANARVNAAAYRLSLGDVDGAYAQARQTLVLAQRSQSPQMIDGAIQHLATVAALGGDTRHAARLRGYVDAWHARESTDREPTERKTYAMLAAALDERLAPTDRERLEAEGAQLSEEEAISEALTLAPPVRAAISA